MIRKNVTINEEIEKWLKDKKEETGLSEGSIIKMAIIKFMKEGNL